MDHCEGINKCRKWGPDSDNTSNKQTKRKTVKLTKVQESILSERLLTQNESVWT